MSTIAELREKILKCNRCGNCQYFCPSYLVSRMEAQVARGKIQLIKRNLEEENDFSEVFIKRVNQCLLCGNCSQNCPAGICPDEIIEEIRELYTEKKGPQPVMEKTAKSIGNLGNITGDSRENRLLWFQNSDGAVAKIGKPAEYIYLPGCVSTLYPSSYSIPQTFASLLNKAGLDWTILGENENCCSYPLIIGGMKKEAKKIAEENVRGITALGAKNIVTSCPSCYHTWKELYPNLLKDMPALNILHGAQLLVKLCREGAFKFRETNCTVTYHDPCDLGRKSGIYDEPREVLKSIPGVRLAEMRFIREKALCCGGGGNLEMNDSALSGKVAQHRITQALDTKADIIVTSCQQCKRTLAGGARQKRAKIKVMDLSEFIFNALE
jgi:Fe-S oxidoreductase